MNYNYRVEYVISLANGMYKTIHKHCKSIKEANTFILRKFNEKKAKVFFIVNTKTQRSICCLDFSEHTATRCNSDYYNEFEIVEADFKSRF